MPDNNLKLQGLSRKPGLRIDRYTYRRTMRGMMTRLLCAIGFSVMALHAMADEVEDTINSALAAYKAGKPGEATDLMRKATEMINAKAGITLSAALPNKIGLWNGGKIDTQTLDGIGGGQAVDRGYRKGPKEDKSSITANVSIVANSPTLTQVSSFLANPALGALLGAKSRAVGSNTAMVIQKEGLLQMVVEGKFLIAVRGKKCTEDQLAELAAGVNLEVLKALK